jgi:hypothetical protein
MPSIFGRGIVQLLEHGRRSHDASVASGGGEVLVEIHRVAIVESVDPVPDHGQVDLVGRHGRLRRAERLPDVLLEPRSDRILFVTRHQFLLVCFAVAAGEYGADRDETSHRPVASSSRRRPPKRNSLGAGSGIEACGNSPSSRNYLRGRTNLRTEGVAIVSTERS